MVKILRKSWENHEAQFPKLSVFIGQKLIIRHYCIQNVTDRIQIQVYNIDNETVNHFSQFISVKVKKNLRKSQAQFGEKLRKFKHRQNDGFLIKKTSMCSEKTYVNTNAINLHNFLRWSLFAYNECKFELSKSPHSFEWIGAASSLDQ